MQVVVDGIVTNYELLGNKKPTILILHGWMRSLKEWLPLAAKLTKTHTVIIVDLPGFGLTSRPETSYTIYDYASFVQHFLNKIDRKDITLLGHSFGGRIGIILGAKTNILSKLILVDSAAVETKSLNVRIRIALNKIAISPVKLLFPQKVEKLKSLFGSDDYQNAGIMRDIFINTINEDLTPLLKQVKVQTLIIWGEKDTIRPLSEAQIIEKNISNATLRIIWGAGHSPYLDKPKEFLEIVQETL